MSVSLKQIEDQARALSAEERASLAESMLESLHPRLSEIESAWAEEIERRGAAFDRGGRFPLIPQKMCLPKPVEWRAVHSHAFRPSRKRRAGVLLKARAD